MILLSSRTFATLLAGPVLSVVAASPLEAQQYWLGGGMGSGYNAPNRTLTDTMNEHLLQRHMTSRGASGAGFGSPGGVPGQHGSARQRQGSDPSFRLNNTAGLQVNEVYVSSSSDSQWGPDRLGRNVLPPGQTMVVRLPNGQCFNDIRIVYANGRTQDRRGIDTCSITDLTLP